MHKDAPPGLFDARRALSHVLSHGLIAGFILGLLVHFAWTLWRENSGAVAQPAGGMETMVDGVPRRGETDVTPTPPADVRY